MARKWLSYEAGTPQRRLLAAVEARYGDNEEFFRDVAKRAKIAPESAGGTFYGFVRGTRSLPETHRAAYLGLLTIKPALLDELEALRDRPVTPLRRDHQAEVAKGLRELTKEVRRLTRRVRALEQQAQPKKRRGGSNG